MAWSKLVFIWKSYGCHNSKETTFYLINFFSFWKQKNCSAYKRKKFQKYFVNMSWKFHFFFNKRKYELIFFVFWKVAKIEKRMDDRQKKKVPYIKEKKSLVNEWKRKECFATFRENESDKKFVNMICKD